MRAIESTTAMSMVEAEAAIRAALAEQGFGVLTEIDIAATFRAKLGIERTPMKILGACNPTLAHEALQHDPSAALLLPCNVVLESIDGGTKISVVDPRELMAGPAMAELAAGAAERLQAAVDAV